MRLFAFWVSCGVLAKVTNIGFRRAQRTYIDNYPQMAVRTVPTPSVDTIPCLLLGPVGLLMEIDAGERGLEQVWSRPKSA